MEPLLHQLMLTGEARSESTQDTGGEGGGGEGWRRRQGLSVCDYRVSAVSCALACRNLASTSTFSWSQTVGR